MTDSLRVLSLVCCAISAAGAVAYAGTAGPSFAVFAVISMAFLILTLTGEGGYVSRSDNSRTEITNNIYTPAPAAQPQPAVYSPPQMQQPQIIMMPSAQQGMTPEMVAAIVRGMTQAQVPLSPQASYQAAIGSPQARYMGDVIDVTPERARPMLLLPSDSRHLTAEAAPASLPMRLLKRVTS